MKEYKGKKLHQFKFQISRLFQFSYICASQTSTSIRLLAIARIAVGFHLELSQHNNVTVHNITCSLYVLIISLLIHAIKKSKNSEIAFSILFAEVLHHSK